MVRRSPGSSNVTYRAAGVAQGRTITTGEA